MIKCTAKEDRSINPLEGSGSAEGRGSKQMAFRGTSSRICLREKAGNRAVCDRIRVRPRRPRSRRIPQSTRPKRRLESGYSRRRPIRHRLRTARGPSEERRSASEGTNKAKTAATHLSINAFVTLYTPDGAGSEAPWAALVKVGESESAASPRALRGVDRLAGAPVVLVKDRLKTFATAALRVVCTVTSDRVALGGCAGCRRWIAVA